ncbi:hypothetical protein C3L33_16485, partial [Rhododendron williamsianum]
MALSLLALKRFISPKSLRPATAAYRLFTDKPSPDFAARDRSFDPAPVRNFPDPSAAYETDESLNIREDMPGAGKENVEVLLKPNYLILNGEREMKQEKDGAVVTLVYKYNATYYISEEKFNLNQVKAVIKNGVLNVVVPKVRKDHKGD